MFYRIYVNALADGRNRFFEVRIIAASESSARWMGGDRVTSYLIARSSKPGSKGFPMVAHVETASPLEVVISGTDWPAISEIAESEMPPSVGKWGVEEPVAN